MDTHRYRESPAPSTRLLPIDGMRGVAFLMILAFHIDPRPLPGLWWGVDLFFVVSGFVITRLLDAEQARSGQIDLAGFAVRRALRLVPAFLAMLATFALYLEVSTRHPEREAYHIALAAGFVMNWARAFGAVGDGPLGHTWTLAVEEQFYLLWPIVLILLPRRRRVPILLGLLLAAICWRAGLALHGADVQRTYNGADTRCDGLLIGCLLALVRWRPSHLRWAARLVPVPLGVLALAAALMPYQSVGAQACGTALCALAAGWLVLATLEHGWFARVLSGRALRHVGGLSYALYLWHLPVLVLGARHVPAGWRGTLVLLAVIWGCAMLSRHVVERPCQRLRHYRPFRPALEAAEA